MSASAVLAEPAADLVAIEAAVPADLDEGERVVPAAGVLIDGAARYDEQLGYLLGSEQRLVELDGSAAIRDVTEAIHAR